MVYSVIKHHTGEITEQCVYCVLRWFYLVKIEDTGVGGIVFEARSNGGDIDEKIGMKYDVFCLQCIVPLS